MNAETNPHHDDPERRATIDSLVTKAISDGYFTTTGDYVNDDLEAVARLVYYDWCRSHDRAAIEYDDEEFAVSCSHDKPLVPASTAQLRGLAAEFGLEIGGQPEEWMPYIRINLFQKTPSYLPDPPNESEFLGRLAAILTDPRSFQPSPA